MAPPTLLLRLDHERRRVVGAISSPRSLRFLPEIRILCASGARHPHRRRVTKLTVSNSPPPEAPHRRGCVLLLSRRDHMNGPSLGRGATPSVRRFTQGDWCRSPPCL